MTADDLIAAAEQIPVHVWRADPRRTNYQPPAPESYDDWLRVNHADDWRALQPDAVARYEALQHRLRGMRPDADDEGKYGREFSA